MKILSSLRTLAVLAGVFTAGVSTFAATLKIGDAAPQLKVAKWVQGDPVTSFDNKHVYIVEFWATWCGPCRASIPHLNETWQKFKDKDLIVIGQDCWEQDESQVPGFVNKMGDKMTYRVALDDKSDEKDGFMAINWMKAAGQNGIPTAFIINRQGKIAWIGHPMSLEESVLEDILADKFDVAAYSQKYAKQQEEQEQRQAVTQRLMKAMRDKDWDTADSALTEVEKTLPAQARVQTAPMRIQILLGRKDYDGACKFAETTSEGAPNNVQLQNALAWTLATAKSVDDKGLAVARKIADRANTASNGKEPQILDTVARIQFMTGQTNEAVATEQKAIDLAPDEMKSYLKRFLDDYKAGKLPSAEQ